MFLAVPKDHAQIHALTASNWWSSQLKSFRISGHFHSVHVLRNYSLERFKIGTESSIEILRISGFL